jgi:tetratricopeptide (TPR) repeat protein
LPGVKALECVTAYRQAAERYRAGNPAEAAAALQRLDREQLKIVVPWLDALRMVPQSLRDLDHFRPFSDFNWRAFAWDRPTLRAAGMLHVEAAVTAFRANDEADFKFHSEMASTVLAIADRPRPKSNEVTGTTEQRATLAISLLLVDDSGAFPSGKRYLSVAIGRFPDDPQLLLTVGTLNEADATRWIAPVPRVDDSDGARRSRAVRNAALHDAAGLFERAIASDPSLLEARVRLAHVRILERKDNDATTLLVQVLAAQPPPEWTYVARLMLGDVDERAGKTDEANRLYVDAIAVQPDGQSAYIALSEAMYAGGNRSAATDVLARLYGRHLTPESHDPWWEYPFGNWRDAEPMLESLRAEARQ